MRYKSQHKRETYQRIVTSAGRLFRQHGYLGAGVDAIMKSAGLTHGGFYAHFASKDALFAAVLSRAVAQARQWLLAGLEERQGLDRLRGIVGRYLSRPHQQAVADGCPLPALISDLARAQDLPRAAFEEQLLSMIDDLAATLPSASGIAARERAIATLALCVGGVSLARAVSDPVLADELLAACRQFAIPEDWQAGETLQPLQAD